MRRLLDLWRLAAIALLLPLYCHAENYSDVWWSPNESGWGVTIADHETQLFAVMYAYDTDGSPMWFTVPGGTFNANRTFFSGDVYRTTGPSYTGPFNPSAVGTTKVGTASFDFSNAAAGTVVFSYTIGSVSRTKQIQRLGFGSASANFGLDRTDLWWNAAESGWGLSLAQHGNNVFGVWYTYGPSGHPLFVILPGVTMASPDSFTGTLYTTTGPGYDAATFDPAQIRVTPVGSATLNFAGDTGTFTASVQGVTQTKTITRQPFGGVMTAPLAADPKRVEENTSAVTFSGAWTRADPSLGWSGGSAMQSNTAGATASITFSGTSIRWIGSRGRGHGIASVSVDGGPPKEVNLFARPTDEAHTPVITIDDLTEGTHTLTITVTGRHDSQGEGNAVVVDSFDIQPGTTVSHWQDTDPNAKYSAGWTKSDPAQPYSGTGVSNLPELPVSAHETSTTGETVSLPFRGTAIAWVGYRGPDAGIAQVQIDGGAPTEVDLYSPTSIYQPVVFSMGMGDGNHTLTITATGRHNAAATGTRVVVDAFDVTTPGRRYEEYDPSITYAGNWTPHNDARVWSEGATATSSQTGATATFHFIGTSVSWIGCEKDSAAGVANIYLDGTFVKQQKLFQQYPIEGYQMTIFRQDGLANGPHDLKIEVANIDGSYVVVDAFDVRQ